MSGGEGEGAELASARARASGVRERKRRARAACASGARCWLTISPLLPSRAHPRPRSKNTRFCLIGNYVSKIIPALQSRCTKFRFAPLKKEQIEGKLRSIVEREGLSARCSDDGIEAVLRLAHGDMRKVLNVLQATASGFEQVTCETVHLCTGQPLPSDIAAIQRSLMNDDFEPAFATLQAASHGKGLSLVDIVAELAKVNFSLKMPPEVRVLLADKLSDIEYRLAFGTNDKIQGAALVGAYAQAREAMRKYVPPPKAASA